MERLNAVGPTIEELKYQVRWTDLPCTTLIIESLCIIGKHPESCCALTTPAANIVIPSSVSFFFNKNRFYLKPLPRVPH